MGCIGAAVATLISRVVEVCIVVVVPHLKTAKYTVLKGLYRSLRIPKNLVKKMTVTSFPLLLNEFKPIIMEFWVRSIQQFGAVSNVHLAKRYLDFIRAGDAEGAFHRLERSVNEYLSCIGMQ